MTIAVMNDFHSIKERNLPKLDIDEDFSWIQHQSTGFDSSIIVGKHRSSKEIVVLKLFNKKLVREKDFFREHHYNYFLSPHPNIVNSFETAFQTEDEYVFAQEVAPAGDISMHLRESGLGEYKTKKVISQVYSALGFIHSKDLVHGAVHADHILVFNHDMSLIKLCDFGTTNLSGKKVMKVNDLIPWEPPEVCETKANECYCLSIAIDAWHLGILIYYCLIGNYPWFSADQFDPYYNDWVAWTTQKTKSVPEQFKFFSPELLRLFAQLLDPNPDTRSNISILNSYMSEPWLIDQFNCMDLKEEKLDKQFTKRQRSSFDNMKEKISTILHIKK